MALNRRQLLSASLASASWLAGGTAWAAPRAIPGGRDAAQFGLRANTDADQSRALARAIDACARDGAPLFIPPGRYRCAMVKLPSGAQLVGVAGATMLELSDGPSLLTSADARNVRLSGLTLDGGGRSLPARRGLLHAERVDGLDVGDCEVTASGGNGLWLDRVSGAIRATALRDCAASALVSFNARGLVVAQNTIHGAGENGIEILRDAPGPDATLVVDNRIEAIRAGPGGSGQYGNAVVAYRAADVIVRGNRIRDCDYSGVRGNSASNIQILGNGIVDAREVAIYSEFSFEAAVIAQNSIDGAALGISVCNFNEGGRIAAVTGNIVRNLHPRRPDGASDGEGGIGIHVEADTAVTGNVVEKAPFAGIMAGWGKYLRDIAITGNVVREAFIGVGLSAFPGAGRVLVSDNVIAGTQRGAIVGMDHGKAVTADLSQPGATVPGNVTLGVNQVR
ncbi:MAG: TIGR03808 family TAT-translocated repetitive protein [Xanthobacteraceae bacterium]|nr:MAG: TIGR03808 family TAT-translocated repetitive protein [Xanthobacteraceae bacterium]